MAQMNRLCFSCCLFIFLCHTAVGQTPLTIKGLSENAPLSLTASATSSRLLLDVTMKSEWHVYSRDVGGGQPVAISMAKKSGFKASGALVLPPSISGKLTNSFRLELPIQALDTKGLLQATFEFMACDPLACMPPMTVEISGEIPTQKRIKVLLAVDVEDDRSKRIVEFLNTNGFATTVKTYAAITKANSDAHDVILLDSKRFGSSTRNARKDVLAFPKSETPMVAVGFLGTELIEAHGIAMTSGYI